VAEAHEGFRRLQKRLHTNRADDPQPEGHVADEELDNSTATAAPEATSVDNGEGAVPPIDARLRRVRQHSCQE
jgi:hypothetical protein